MRHFAFAVLLCAGPAAAAPVVDAVHLVWRSADDGTPGTRDEWVTRAGQRRELIAVTPNA